jgi:hypothetical protein
MLSFRKPSAQSIHRFLTEQAKLPFSYSAIGATARTPPAGYAVDHARTKLGELGWLGYPYVRHKQERFRRDSTASLLRAVGSEKVRTQ